MLSKIALSIGFCALILSVSEQTYSQNKSIAAPATSELSDRERDGLIGPVRRVTVESAKITIKNGAIVEGQRVLSAITTYDARGRKIDNTAYPIESTSLPGKERYKYDDKGNIIEMELRGPNGAILSKELYAYVLDELGNWKRMTTSLAVFQDGKLGDEPVEVTYRTITYFYSQEVAKLTSGSSNVPPGTGSATLTEVKASRPVDQIVTEVSAVETPNTEKNEPRVSDALAQPVKTADPPSDASPVSSGTKQPQESSESTPADDSGAKTVPEVNTKLETSNISIETKTAEPSPSSATKQPEESSESIPAADSGTKTAPEVSTKLETSNVSTETKIPEPSPSSSASSSQPVSDAPQTALSYYNLGVSYLDAGKQAEAAKALGEAIFKDPEYAAAYLKLGLAYSSLRQYKEAIAVFKMAIRIKRDLLDAEAYYQMGQAYSALGKHSDALNSFKQALYIARADAISAEGQSARVPTVEELHYNLGLAYHNLARFQEAIKELRQVIAVNPGFAEAYYGLAVCYIGLGDRKSAEKQQKILAPLNPDLAARISQALATNHIPPPSVTDGMLGAGRP
jgi:tetratricopeptide (TPR) repeat protein